MSFANAMLPIQKPLTQLAFGTDPRYRTVAAVISASRRNNLINVQDFGYDGKKRVVQINYYDRQCDAVGSCDDNMCSEAIVIEPKQRQFKLNRCIASLPYALKRDDIRTVGDNWTFSAYALASIRSGLDSVRKGLNDQLNAFFIENVGCQPDGSPSKAISLTDPNTAAIRPRGMFEIEKTFSDAGLVDPIIVGGGDVYIWERGTTIGGINAQGQRIDQMRAPGEVYYDKGLEDAFGDPTKGHVVAFSAQSIKFIAWNENRGMFATDFTSIDDLDRMYQVGVQYMHGSIVDPLTGLVWDLDLRYDECSKRWTFQYRLNWDIFIMPEAVCNIDCVNGIFHFTTCLAPEPDCGQITPPTPPTPNTYEWTPGNIFPLFVGELTLAGQTSAPSVTVTNLAELVAMLNDSVQGYQFSVDGSNIVYTGYKAISGSANGGTLTIEFEEETT